MAIACQEATVYSTHDVTLREFLNAAKATFSFTCPTARVAKHQGHLQPAL